MGAGASDGWRALARRRVVWPSWALLSALALAGSLLERLPLWAQLVPLGASVVALGLPHGATDHVVGFRLTLRRVRALPLVAFGLVYLASALVYVAVWWIWPVGAFAAFIALTWFHWGQGDLFSLVAWTGAGHLPSRVGRALAVAVRGGLPMLVPLLAWPETYAWVAGLTAAPFGAEAEARAAVGALPRAQVGSLYAGLVVFYFWVAITAISMRRAGRGARADLGRDAFEVVLLALFFWRVPPLVAVGAYFCAWHAARHVLRLVEADAGALARGGPRAALARWARDAAPITALALAMIVGLAFAVPARPEGVAGAVGLYLVGIAALTLPHVAVVVWMDRAQRVWAPAPPP